MLICMGLNNTARQQLSCHSTDNFPTGWIEFFKNGVHERHCDFRQFIPGRFSSNLHRRPHFSVDKQHHERLSLRMNIILSLAMIILEPSLVINTKNCIPQRRNVNLSQIFYGNSNIHDYNLRMLLEKQ